MLEWPLTLLRHYPLGLAKMQRSLSWEFLGYIHTRQGQAPFQYLINSKKASSLLVLWDEGSLKVKRNCFLSLQRHPSLWSACGVCHLLEQSRDKLWLICILSPSLLIKFLFLYFPYLVTTFLLFYYYFVTNPYHTRSWHTWELRTNSVIREACSSSPWDYIGIFFLLENSNR